MKIVSLLFERHICQNLSRLLTRKRYVHHIYLELWAEPKINWTGNKLFFDDTIWVVLMSVVKLTVQQGLEIHSLEIGRPSRYAVCAYGSNIFEVHGFVRGCVGILHAFYTDCFQILLKFYWPHWKWFYSTHFLWNQKQCNPRLYFHGTTQFFPLGTHVFLSHFPYSYHKVPGKCSICA